LAALKMALDLWLTRRTILQPLPTSSSVISLAGLALWWPGRRAALTFSRQNKQPEEGARGNSGKCCHLSTDNIICLRARFGSAFGRETETESGHVSTSVPKVPL